MLGRGLNLPCLLWSPGYLNAGSSYIVVTTRARGFLRKSGVLGEERGGVKAELGSDEVGDLGAGGVDVHRRVVEEGAEAEAVEEGHRAVGQRGQVGGGGELARLDAAFEHVFEPLVVAGVEAGGEGAQARLASGAGPEPG